MPWAKLYAVAATKILRRLLLLPYQVFAALLFLMLLLLSVPASFVAGLRDPRGDRAHRCLTYWARANLVLAGLRVKVEGLDRLDPKAAYVFMPNHASFLDILLTLAYVPYNFRMITKEEMFVIPLVGWLLRRSGQIPLNRKSPRKGLRSLELAGRLIAEGISVVVFPEGTRTTN
ncbi:MAG: 1-acyl-sn-glycerol-3-phosphate acyltransferase, partial [Deltaproteobacteria bacterium]|nr:1-acyl-sn-glycerol-3-phosphate acyltransferase [Deltaproteobacteria bacterium]